MIGGDATRILPERIQTGSIDFLFINHPEPPQQIGGFESQGKHMLTLVRERRSFSPALPYSTNLSCHTSSTLSFCLLILSYFMSYLIFSFFLSFFLPILSRVLFSYCIFSHLIQDLFGELARVLKSNGMLTIVTDNLWYAHLSVSVIDCLSVSVCLSVCLSANLSDAQKCI